MILTKKQKCCNKRRTWINRRWYFQNFSNNVDINLEDLLNAPIVVGGHSDSFHEISVENNKKINDEVLNETAQISDQGYLRQNGNNNNDAHIATVVKITENDD